MRLFHRFTLFLLLISIGNIHPAFAAKHPVHSGSSKGRKIQKPIRPDPAIVDTNSEAYWRKKLPWLYRDTGLVVYRESVILPLLKRHGLRPVNLAKRGGFVELTLPKGRPLHEYAYEAESLSQVSGIRVLEGHEFDPPEAKVEYSLQSASGSSCALRLLLGKNLLAGASRMAIVVVSLGTVSDEESKSLLAFPEALTLAIPGDDSTGVRSCWWNLPSNKQAFLELPMEPSGYPYVKPGRGALFIHHSRSEVEKLLQARQNLYPSAAGFATTFGDRAIENRPLLENILRYTSAHSKVFLDLTSSSRSFTATVAFEASAVAYVARIQEPDATGKILEAEMLRRCERAGKTGEGIWVLRYFPGLPNHLQRLIEKNGKQLNEIGLQWVTLGALR